MEVPGEGVPSLCPGVQVPALHLGEGSQFNHSCVTLSKDPAAPFSAIKTSHTHAGAVLRALVLVVSQEAAQV